MKKFYNAVSVLFLCALGGQAQVFVNGQAARAEFGQYTFTFGGATPGTTSTLPNQNILGGAGGLAWANGTLFVADSNRLGIIPQDNRVLMFNTGLVPAPNADLTNAHSYSNYLCNVCAFPAFNQLGQPSFNAAQAATTSAPNAFNPGLSNDPGQSNMRTPTAVATDGNTLAVADTDNNRVLIWHSIPASMNQPADVVLGQADFTHATVSAPPTQSSLLAPQGVWIQNGKLLVADTQDYRVLIWNSIPTSNNQPADLVLGQSNFTTGTQPACAATQLTPVAAANELCNPVSVTADASHVFVADIGFNRVLIWNSFPSSNAQNADVVVGQPDMTSTMANNPNVCQHTGAQVQCPANLNFPRFALSDGTRLFIADGGNDRILIYNSIPTQNGVAADNLLGQPTFFVDNVTNPASSILSTAVDTTSAVDVTPSPTALAFDGTNLYVSDPLNNRVLVFSPANTQLPDNSVVNWASEIIRQEGVASIVGTNITANDTVSITIGSNTYKYTVQKNDTIDTIAQGLVSAINANNGDQNVIAIFAGSGTGSLYVSSRGIDLGFDSIAFSATSSNTSNESITVSGNGYLTSGNAATGSPGMLVEINGSNLSDVSPGNPAQAAMTGTIPTSLGGAQVFMDGVATPVYKAASNQVVSQIPFQLVGRNSTSIVVRTTHNDGSVTVTNATPIYIAAANPGIFSQPANPGDARPWPAILAFHQPGNPQAVVDVTGTVNAGDVLYIKINNANTYSYTVQSGDSVASIVTGLVNAVNRANDPQVSAQAGGAFNRVVIVAKQGGAAGNNIPISTSTSASAKITLTAYTNATCCDVIPGTTLTASNPAAPGETVTLSAAGLGVLQGLDGGEIANIPVGQPYSQAVPNSALASVSATIGSSNTTAQVVNAGLATGAYGIYNVQIIIPQSQATNTATPVYIAQNAFISNIVNIPVGPANSNPFLPPASTGPITINIDSPNGNASALSGTAAIGGWAVDQTALINAITVGVDGTMVGYGTYGGSRPDVCAASPFASTASCANGNTNVGWNYLLDTTQFPDGSHTLEISAIDANGTRLTQGGSFTTSNYGGANSTIVDLDTPGDLNPSFQGLTNFGGWVVNPSSPIGSVTVLIDGVSRGSAFYGVGRPDVCAVYTTSPNCTNGTSNVGWSYLLDTSSLVNGTHSFAISATAANGQRGIQAHDFTVANWTTANSILLSVSNPNSQNPTLSGSQIIGGWAIDPSSLILGIAVAVDGVPLGDAPYGGNRADACAGNPGLPGCPNVGWSFSLDTTRIPDGSHLLAVTVIPQTGQGFTKTIPFQVRNLNLGTNPTSVTIDQPNGSSTPLSGLAAVGGWAINSSSVISTVEVLVDGSSNGFAAWGGARTDVCAKIQGAGCPNVGWNYLLDTSPLTNGTHSFQVIVTAADGTRASASSTFVVANNVGPSPTSVVITQPTAQSSAYQGLAIVNGNAMGTSAGISGITITVDGYPYGSANFTPAGPNVPVNWNYILNTVQFADGPHTIGVTATASDGTFALASITLQVANWTSPNPTLINIDRPNAQNNSFSGSVNFSGWALNPASAIAAISIAIDNVPFGNAAVGGNRPDVCNAYPNAPGCPNLGWNVWVGTTQLFNGMHTLSVTATTAAGQSSTTSSSFIVVN